MITGTLPRSHAAEKMDKEQREVVERELGDAIIQVQYEAMKMIVGRWESTQREREGAKEAYKAEIEIDRAMTIAEKQMNMIRSLCDPQRLQPKVVSAMNIHQQRKGQ